MKTFKLEIVTAEKLCYTDEVNTLVAPGIEGQLAILPNHTPLITILQPGELLIRKNNEEIYWAVSGGFLEVRHDKVIVLADACEQAEEIDIAHAEEAKHRAEESMKQARLIAGTPTPKAFGDSVSLAQAEASLRRALVRLKVAKHRKKSRARL